LMLIRKIAVRSDPPDGFDAFSPLNREPGGERPLEWVGDSILNRPAARVNSPGSHIGKLIPESELS
jgi:hypothetical protein